MPARRFVTLLRLVVVGTVCLAALLAFPLSEASDSACMAEIDETIATESRWSVAAVMSQPMQAADVIASALVAFASARGLAASAITPLEQDSVLQKTLLPILTAYDLLYAYVGFADGTFIMIQASEDGTALTGAFRPNGTDVLRRSYAIDATTGDQSGPDTESKLYDPRQRPWYTAVEAAGSASWSGAYIYASNGQVGNTFAVPGYDQEGMLAYVIGVDSSLTGIGEALQDVSSSAPSDHVAFVMDGDGYLYGTSYGTEIDISTSTEELVFAPDANASIVSAGGGDGALAATQRIAITSSIILSATFLSDCSFFHNTAGGPSQQQIPLAVTVRRWTSDASLDLYAVSVESTAAPPVGTAECSVIVSENVAGYGAFAISSALAGLASVVEVITETIKLGLLPSNSTEWTLNGTAQKTFWGLSKTFCDAAESAVFIAFPDDTFLFFSCDDGAGGRTYSGFKQSDPANGARLLLEYHVIDADTGAALTSEGVLEAHDYHATSRPWYSAAAASDGAKPIFSEPYPFFGDNNIGLTRAQALQNPASARDVLCVVGADFVISESTGALFEPLNADGRSVYAMLSDTGELVATSNGVRVTSSENDNSNDPTGAACDENVVAVDETVAIEGRYAVASLLGAPMQAAHVIKNSLAALAVTLGTSESGITPTEQDSVVQRHLLPVLASFDLLYAYIGFVDGTFAMIRVDTTDGSLVGAWREAGDGLQRITYPVNASTGRQSGDYGSSSSYDPRIRQWYVTAVAAGGPSWSGAYIFASTGAVGNTFAVPVFDSVTGELVYVIGVDLSLDTISDVLYDLSAANPSDQVAYAMDGSGFLYGSSLGATLPVATSDAQLVYAPALPWNAGHAEYRVAASSSSIVDGTFWSDTTFFMVDEALAVSVRKWSSGANLDLFIVSVGTMTDSSESGPSTGNDDDDASLCSVVVAEDAAGFGLAELNAEIASLSSSPDIIKMAMELGLLEVASDDVAKLNSTAQVTIWGLARRFCQADSSAVFVGFPDDAVLYFSCDGGLGDGASTYLGIKGSNNGSKFRMYAFDALTGLVHDSVPKVTTDINVTTRPWYRAAAASVSVSDGIFTEPYLFFESSTVGVTYAQAVRSAHGELLGVVGADLYVSTALSDLLSPLNAGGRTVFVMDTDSHSIVGASNGMSVATDNLELIDALSADDFAVRTAANVAQTFGTLPVTVSDPTSSMTVSGRRFTRSNLDWTVLAVDAEVTSISPTSSSTMEIAASASCAIAVERDVASSSTYTVQQFLNRAVNGGGSLAATAAGFAVVNGTSASGMAPLARDSILQQLCLRVVDSFEVRGAYIGFEDGTHVAATVAEGGVYTGYWRPAGSGMLRTYFSLDPDTGLQSGNDIGTKLYDPRERGWYGSAKAAGAPVFSEAYVFANNGQVGMTYATPVYDTQSGALAYVIGVDFSLGMLSDILATESVNATSGPVAFIMDSLGYLYGSNDPTVASVTEAGEQAYAPNATAPRVALAAERALTGTYLADSTFVVPETSFLVTVRTVGLASLPWPLFVVVSEEVTTESSVSNRACALLVSEDVLTGAFAETEMFLGRTVEAVTFFEEMVMNENIPSDSAAYHDKNSQGQLLFFAIAKFACMQVGSSAYVGFPDDTFYLLNFDGDSEEFKVWMQGPSSPERSRFYANSATGMAGEFISNVTYSATGRPWYQAAVGAGAAVYTAPYVFASSGAIGMTYAAPVYDTDGVLKCVVALDFVLSDINALFAQFNTGGETVFVMDSETSALLATSNGVNSIIELEDGSLAVASAVADVSDYYISTAAAAVHRAQPVADGARFALDTIDVNSRKFEKFTLDWTLVSISLVFNEAVRTTSAMEATSTVSVSTTAGGRPITTADPSPTSAEVGSSLDVVQSTARSFSNALLTTNPSLQTSTSMLLPLEEFSGSAYVTTAVLGITVGVIVLVAIVVIVLVYCLASKKSVKKTAAGTSSPPSASGSHPRSHKQQGLAQQDTCEDAADMTSIAIGDEDLGEATAANQRSAKLSDVPI